MERPTPSIRSTKGCWTCRLRKKKCDEIRPGCERCASSTIECHYGPRPQWIEDPVLGKEELARVKAVVGRAASRKRAEHRSRLRIAAVQGDSYPSPASPLSNSRGYVQLQTTHDNLVPPGNTPTQTPRLVEPDASWLSTWIKDQEANLIMHYLDHVFYIQFRFHTPSISEGGRGWFLSLLTRTKPLYHAVLSLSAFHQQSLLSLERGEGKTAYINELERQYNLTLKELQVFIQAESLVSYSEACFERNVQILACSVLLLSFELFNGGKANWQFHLKAASDIVLAIHDMERPESPMLERQRLLKIRSPEATGLRFFGCCTIWSDILSTVSTGSKANLADHHQQLLSSAADLEPNFDFRTTWGTQNWVMILISDISNLAFERSQWKEPADLDVHKIEVAAREIERRLVTQHKITLEELQAFRRRHGSPPSHSLTEIYSKHTVLVITCIFASTAKIYLETAKGSAVTPSAIEKALHEVMEVFAMIPEPRMLRALVWPLCVSGCMASSTDEQDFFKSLTMSAVDDSATFGNTSEALQILERSWGLQQQQSQLVDCASTIKDIGSCILLV